MGDDVDSGDEEDGPEEMDGGGDLNGEVRKSCPLVQVFLKKSQKLMSIFPRVSPGADVCACGLYLIIVLLRCFLLTRPSW